MAQTELSVADIRWALEPIVDVESDDDPLVDVLLDAEAYQAVMQESLHGLAVVVRAYDKLQKNHNQLLQEFRERRSK